MTLLMIDLSSAPGVNVALGKTAFQTSEYKPTEGNASLAVDGNTDTNYHHGSCTHTVDSPGETNASWWVDLGQSYVIDRVLIFNRQDVCPERINPFNIHIGDSDQVSTNPRCGGDHQINLNQPSISVSCPGMKGRYVGVRLPGPSRVLTLCEVQVFLGRCAPMLLDNSAPNLYKISSELVCRMGDGASYRGTVSMTETGKTCQRWDSQTPHDHYYSTAKFPLSGLEENYCRKTEDWTEVWCFTTDPSTRYEICDVPVCGKV
ncbi:fucolectin-like [Branchiostoma floridae]|uniref:Fucolectin-like n=2 Tax=Branchiostoma floridae TaxID=7739 RepID=A0A9J7LIY3_BRAFL|nr:fucolectin-like [Branchiostoma floridae]